MVDKNYGKILSILNHFFLKFANKRCRSLRKIAKNFDWYLPAVKIWKNSEKKML